MCDNSTGLARSLRQMDTPLSQSYFSEANITALQRGIRQAFRDRTGISIDQQSRDDLVALMRAEYINSSGDPRQGVENQVLHMNSQVTETAVRQIGVGVKQFINFMRDTEKVKAPMELPKSTTTYGNKIPDQDFGI
jgi:hypothetical protein